MPKLLQAHHPYYPPELENDSCGYPVLLIFREQQTGEASVVATFVRPSAWHTFKSEMEKIGFEFRPAFN